MSRKVPLSDFRAVRLVLEPDDFALGGEEPDAPPSDLIEEETWNGIMTLPDDVAIRTSDHNGKAIGEVYWLWGKWIEATGETPDDPLFAPMLDACDDLQSSIFCALHGYYRAGFSALRNVQEVMTVGTCGSLSGSQQYANYRAGSTEFSFGSACDQLSHEPQLNLFNSSLRASGFQSLWDARDPVLPGGFARKLYRELCNYAHTRPGFAEADLWESNGPVYASKAFRNWYYAYLRTVSLCSISILLSGSAADRALVAELFIDDPNVVPPDVQEAFKLA
jgi:hypothetical protein